RLHVTLNRPKVRNAMSFAMVRELTAVFEAIKDDRSIRAVILRGAGGHFCAGGDIRDMATAQQTQPGADGVDPVATTNRLFGTMLMQLNRAPQAVVAVLEGAVMGGGFGLACISDVAISLTSAKFRLPETSLGLPPAQIAPFIVERIGLTAARRLAVTGGRLDGQAAHALGLVHFVEPDTAALEARLCEVIEQVRRCAPEAVAVTKSLMHAAHHGERTAVLDGAANSFAKSVRQGEGMAGMMAFLSKKPAPWAAPDPETSGEPEPAS
ncbi:MAG: enoyl-CoA hydratase/isomerase family protein, partial [Nannocystaceae bacterium]